MEKVTPGEGLQRIPACPSFNKFCQLNLLNLFLFPMSLISISQNIISFKSLIVRLLRGREYRLPLKYQFWSDFRGSVWENFPARTKDNVNLINEKIEECQLEIVLQNNENKNKDNSVN